MALRAKRGRKSEKMPPPKSSGDAAAPEASPPTPTSSSPLPLPPKEENQPGPSGDQEPAQSPGRGGLPEERLPSLARWLFQQSLGRLPGGASAKRREGGTREAGVPCQRLRVCGTGFFITRVDRKLCLILTMAAVAGILHWYYITTLFERDRHFSHLSTLEKEMSFRTEMGLYYSFFKTIIEAPSFWEGLWMIMNDRLTEYPLVINTLKRFNLYPEVVLASWYRIYTGTMHALGIPTKACWTVNRGEKLSPVESCDGLGDPASFYVAMIFFLNGLMVSVFFLYGMYLSGSRLGGLLTVACYFFNHGESTRVMWTPPLRESFSYPFLVVQMLLLTHILRTQNVNRRSLIKLSISNVFFMLPWHFAQFVLLTQVASVFGIHVVGFIDSCKVQKILYAHMASLAVCFVLMFGNSMLLTSYYAASLVVCWGICEVSSEYLKIHKNVTCSWAIEGVSYLFGTIFLNFLICLILGESDAHISNLLKAKLTDYTDFDTSLFTCAAEFDFIGYEIPLSYLKTFLLPVVLVIFIVVFVKTYQHVVHSEESTEKQEDPFNHGEIVYHAIQLVFFMALAILIMRLKLFLTPHMCIMASLVFSKQLFGWVFSKVPPGAVFIAILAIMAYPGSTNLQKEWEIVGEFSDLPQEELLMWIKANTKQDAVFAGAMPTMPIVKLCALRPIVNHPHYEDAGLRARTKIVYSMYSRKPAAEVKKELLKLGINYYILEDYWCLRKTRPGCSFPEIWDIEDLANAGKMPLCNLMIKDSGLYFRTVFKNSVFQVLEVTKE